VKGLGAGVENRSGDDIYLSFQHQSSSLFVQPSHFSLTVILTCTGLCVCVCVSVCVSVCVCVCDMIELHD
jgi:hypothetical protein